MSEMFANLNEIYGGEVTVNLNRVWQITEDNGGTAKLWYSNNDADTLRVKESKADIDMMIHLSPANPGLMDTERLRMLYEKSDPSLEYLGI